MANTLSIIQPLLHDSRLMGMASSLTGSILATEEGTYIKETAGQTFGVGDFVYVDTNGTIAICTTATNQMDSPIAGLAGQKASGVTGNPVLLNLARPDQIYRMSLWHSTPGSAVATQALLGAVRAIFMLVTAPPTGSGGKWVVDNENFSAIEDATHALARVQIVGFYQGRVFTSATPSVEADASPFTDIYPQVLVKILPFSIASDGTPFTRVIQLA